MHVPEYRLGDLIDDYCPRCRLLLNHAIASLVDGHVVKVICKTCYTEHAYRHGEAGKKSQPSHKRSTLFDQVLAKTAPPSKTSPPHDTPAEEAESSPPKKKRSGVLPRYISRHKNKPPHKG